MRIAKAFVDAVEPSGAIVTLSSSSTVTRALQQLPDSVAVIVCESRPGNEGVRAAETLAAGGRRVTVCTDAAMAPVCEASDVKSAVCGADAVWLVGDTAGELDVFVVNKTGTALLALVAQRYAMRWCVCVDSTKFMRLSTEEFEERKAQLESGPPEEIYQEGPAGVHLEVFNPTFEAVRVDMAHISLVTEDGVLSYRQALAMAEGNMRALEYLDNAVDAG